MLDTHRWQGLGLAMLIISIPFYKVGISFHILMMMTEDFNDVMDVVALRYCSGDEMR